MRKNLSKIKEVRLGLMSETEAENLVQENECTTYMQHREYPLLAGPRMLLKVNTNIGVSDVSSFESELQKFRTINGLKYAPDTMMDHTYVQTERPLWKYMVEEFKGPVGTLPHYSVFDKEKGIERSKLLETIDEMGEGGIAFMTLHPTAGIPLLEEAKKSRMIPTTSRGGAVVLKDAIINKRKENIFADYFDEILKLMKKHQMTVSIGTTFRPACIAEALDAVHRDEIRKQKYFIDMARENGVEVMMEGIGHISLGMIPRYCDLIREYKTPLMPLGPMVTDATTGFDHVTAAVGAAVTALSGNVGIINSVTREEHTGKVPGTESIVEGLKSARVVSHSINVSRFQKYREIDNAVSRNRAESRSCAKTGGIFETNVEEDGQSGCSRCRYECPLAML